jgi:hypothetical protein
MYDLRRRFDDGVAFGVEHDRIDRCPVSGMACPAPRVEFTRFAGTTHDGRQIEGPRVPLSATRLFAATKRPVDPYTGEKMLHSARGRAKRYRVWQRQDGLCPTGQEPITTGSPWDVRCIARRTEGGSDAASNLQMHHLSCRRNHSYARKYSWVTGCRKTPLHRLEPCGLKDPCTVLRGLDAGNRVQLPNQTAGIH